LGLAVIGIFAAEGEKLVAGDAERVVVTVEVVIDEL
jgi:hypothetical protein